jgi:hypothetical protein
VKIILADSGKASAPGEGAISEVSDMLFFSKGI